MSAMKLKKRTYYKMKLYVERVCGYDDDYEKIFEVTQQDGCARVVLCENLYSLGSWLETSQLIQQAIQQVSGDEDE